MANRGRWLTVQHDNDNELPRSRAEAVEKGLKFYFTGKPCRDSKHVARRKASTGRCVECDKAADKRSYEKHKKSRIAKAKAWKGRNKEKVREYCLNRYHNNPKVQAQNAEWRERNQDKVRASRKKWEKNNTEKSRIAKKEYAARNPEKVQSNVRRRRARLRRSDGSHTADDVAYILKRQQYKCAECGCSVKKRDSRQVDHIMPLILGGSNNPSNLQVLCSTCNKKKGGKHPIDFANERGRLV